MVFTEFWCKLVGLLQTILTNHILKGMYICSRIESTIKIKSRKIKSVKTWKQVGTKLVEAALCGD